MIRSEHVDKRVLDYLNENCVRQDPWLKKLNEQMTLHCETALKACCSADCTQLMQVLVKANKAKTCLEIGTSTGINTLAMALALPNDGKIITQDLNDHNCNLARNVWKEAGVDHKVLVYKKKKIFHLFSFDFNVFV